MTDCSTGSQVTYLVIMFVLIFAVHAVPFAFLFRRWRQRYYWGFLPAAFSSLAFLLAIAKYSPCAVIGRESFYLMMAVIFYCFSYVSLIYFKPTLHLLELFGEAIIPVVLAAPFAGAVFALGWLIISLGREQMLMEDGQPTVRHRLVETLAHGFLAALCCMFLGLSLLN